MKTDVEILRAIEAGEALAERWRHAFDQWMLAFKRRARAARVLRERLEEIRIFSVYECVGGPLDGRRIWWRPPLTKYVGRGMYDLGPDHRLHYEELAAAWFGGDGEDPEC